MKKIEFPDSKLSFGQTFIYGVGQMAHQVFDSGAGYLALYVFNISLGVSPVLVGLAQAISRGVDLFTDPLAGYISDALSQHRWALRVLIALGTVFGGVCFALIWLFPPGLTSFQYFIWLLVCFSLASIGWSFCSIPRQSLGFEMTRDAFQRAKLMAVASFMALLCNLGMAWSYAATQLPRFGGTVNGSRWVGSAMGLSIIILGLPFAFFYKVKKSPAAVQTSALDQKALGPREFMRAMGRVRKSRAFLLLAGSVALVIIGVLSTTYGVCDCLVVYYLCGGSQPKAAVLLGGGSTAWIFSGIAFTAPIVYLSKRIGKREALMTFLALALAGVGLKWFCYNPQHPWLFIIPHAFYGAGIGAVAALAPAMTADVCDFEDLVSRSRDSGMYSAFYNWTIKLGISISIAMSGLWLIVTGFDAKNGALQSHSTILAMRLVDIVIPGILIGSSLFLLYRYPLTKKQMERVKTELDQRDLGSRHEPV